MIQSQDVSFADPTVLLKEVLTDALHKTWVEMPMINECHPQTNIDWAICVRNTWIRSLQTSFWTRYPNHEQTARKFAVFGGKPVSKDKDRCEIGGHPYQQGVPSGIPGWGMWEFLHDVAVVELGCTAAAYNKAKVTFVKSAIWQVESEVAADGTEIAKDLRACLTMR